MEITLNEKIVHCTVPLEKYDSSGNRIALATGFVVGFCEQPDGRCVNVIVTNRHVLSGGASIRATFTTQSAQGEPQIGNTVSVSVPSSNFFFHPDSSIDLGFFPFPYHGPNGEDLFFSYLQTNLIPTPEDWSSFDAIESVVMAGYPRGLRDTTNNFPIVRRGITATPPYVDFEGSPIFLVDMPCFEGCSGSPVFLLDSTGYIDERSHIVNIGKRRVFFLGVQHAIPLIRTNVSFPNTPSSSPPPLSVQTYVDLGHIIKSSALLDFEPIIRAHMRP